MKSKNCENCKYFVMWRHDNISDGLCELKDHRTNRKYSCKKWKGIKYKRLKLL